VLHRPVELARLIGQVPYQDFKFPITAASSTDSVNQDSDYCEAPIFTETR
jgi:hypothetical protein